MLHNYLKIALRNLGKHKIFTTINVGGLAIGMAICLLILQYVSFQLSFDQFHKNAANIYRVGNDRFQNGNYTKLIGQGIKISHDSTLYKIDAIVKNLPENSHLDFSVLISYATVISYWKEADHDFTQSDFWHYVQLKPGIDYKKINAQLSTFSDKHFQGNKISGSVEKFHLQPLGKAHLYSDYEYELGKTASATTVWGLLIIAIFIIVIAWVNYINLSTARSMERAREVGIRKVVGGNRKQLISQFLTESAIVNFTAFGIALLLVMLLQPAFNNLLEEKLSLDYLFARGLKGYNILIGLGLLFITGFFLSGFYPAFVLSAHRPIEVLKGKFIAGSKGVFLRKALVIAQFTITAGLIVGSMIVVNQLNFMNNKDLRFDMEQVLVLNPPILTTWH